MENKSIWRSCINTKYGSQNGVGSLLTLEEAMELVFGSLLQKRLISLRKTMCLNWGKPNYGKTLGVEDNLYVMPSLTYIA